MTPGRSSASRGQSGATSLWTYKVLCVYPGARLRRTGALLSKHPLRRLPYTFATLTLALLVLLVASVWDINVFELPGVGIIAIEQSEIGAVIIAFLFVIPAFFIDRVVARQRAHEAELDAEQLRVLQVTMRTVQDIVNNNLNNLQLLRLEAEGCVPDEALALFDRTIQNTAAQLTALGNMKAFAEKPMVSGSGLDAGKASVDAVDRPTPDRP